MKRAILVILLILAAVTLYATPEDFANLIDFQTSMSDLVDMVNSGRFDLIDLERYYILEGSVASTLVVDPNPETFEAWVELVEGEWQGLEQINVYRVWVQLAGPEFAGRIVERLPRDPPPDLILANNKILVVAQYLGEIPAEDGSLEPAVGAIAIR